MEKKCKRCLEVKDRDSDFYTTTTKSRGSTTGHRVKVWASYCKKCSAIIVNETRKKLKRWAIDYKGGKCYDCGLVEDCIDIYDFHHRESIEKEFAVGRSYKSKVKIIKEIDKCDLLCANCHRRRHAREYEQALIKS